MLYFIYDTNKIQIVSIGLFVIDIDMREITGRLKLLWGYIFF